MRGRYEELRARGAELVVIGTGDVDHAREFVESEDVPFPVLVDDDAEAANVAAVDSASVLGLFHPASFGGTWQAHRDGFRVGRPGRRVTQLGATFVLGPGAQLRYAHRDAHTADHAPLDAVLAALES